MSVVVSCRHCNSIYVVILFFIIVKWISVVGSSHFHQGWFKIWWLHWLIHFNKDFFFSDRKHKTHLSLRYPLSLSLTLFLFSLIINDVIWWLYPLKYHHPQSSPIVHQLAVQSDASVLYFILLLFFIFFFQGPLWNDVSTPFYPLALLFSSFFFRLSFYAFSSLSWITLCGGVGGKARTKIKVCACPIRWGIGKLYIFIKTRTKFYVIQASELHGCMFPGSLLPHPDHDKWKCTSFTNKLLYFSESLCQSHTCKMVEKCFNTCIIWQMIINPVTEITYSDHNVQCKP